MTIATICVPIYKSPIKMRSSKDTSGGTEYRFLIRDGESIRVSVDQLWFWTDEWQAHHNAAIADINEGRCTVYETSEDFLAAMDEIITQNEVHSS